MNQETFDLLTELIVMLDDRIVRGEERLLKACQVDEDAVTSFIRGEMQGYQNVAAWARTKLGSAKVSEYTNQPLRNWV